MPSWAMGWELTREERLQAASEARARLLARFKPKPHIPAPPEALVVHEGRLEELRAQRAADKLLRQARRAEQERRHAEAKASQLASVQIMQDEYRRHVAKPTVYYTVDPLAACPEDRHPSGSRRGVTGETVRAQIVQAQDGRCYLCGAPFGEEEDIRPTVDHVVPLARRGSHRRNRLMAHRLCNNAKGDRAPMPCELLYLHAINLRIG